MRNSLGLLFSLALVALFAGALVGAQGFRAQARLFPIVIAVAGLAIALVQVGQEVRRQRSAAVGAGRVGEAGAEQADEDTEIPPEERRRRTAAILGWLLAFTAAIWLLGFPAAVPIAVGAYLKLGAGESWRASLVFALASGVLFYGLFVWAIRIPFEEGLLVALFLS